LTDAQVPRGGHAAARPAPGRQSPIGVFDSGVGGLTVLKALLAALPRERFVYLGDTARLPYGTKSPGTVAAYAVQAAAALAAHGVKCLVVACNTASAVGLAAIRAHLPGLPVIGVIEPGAAAACAVSASGSIAVIATEGTVRGGAYQAAIRRHLPGATVRAVPAPLFVALAEEGLTEGPIAEMLAHHYLDGLLAGGDPPRPDTLVLGCTHFPMLEGVIRKVAGAELAVVDSAATTAAMLRAQLEVAGLLADGVTGGPQLRLLATDAPERFARVGSLFLARPITAAEVEATDLVAPS
jgi:glutamate racemase